jgi:hypothetical protein
MNGLSHCESFVFVDALVDKRKHTHTHMSRLHAIIISSMCFSLSNRLSCDLVLVFLSF